jgi:WD40 repeat protein
MMRARMALAVVSVALLSAFAVKVSAHHSFAAEFDATKPITLRGSITKVERINPHGWIYIDVKETDGTVKNWAIETGAPTALARQGSRKDSIPIGLEVIVKGYRAKDGSTTANGNIITLPDGRDLSLASSIDNTAKPGGGGDR